MKFIRDIDADCGLSKWFAYECGDTHTYQSSIPSISHKAIDFDFDSNSFSYIQIVTY